MDPFAHLIDLLRQGSVRCVLIGVAGANQYALGGSTIFSTQDFDLFLPPEPENELSAWSACQSASLELWCGDEPLDAPRDRLLADRVVAARALVRAVDRTGFQVDLTLAMAGFEFEEVWSQRRTFLLEGVEVPVARLAHIIQSKAEAGRPKDRLFLATHEAALRELLTREG